MAEEATAKTGIRSWVDADFFTEFWYHDANKLRRALEYLKAEVKKNGGMLNLTAKELPINFWVTIQAGANAKIAGEKTDETLSKVSIWQLGLPESEKYNYGQFLDEATVDKTIGSVDAMNSGWQKPLNDAAKIIEIGHLDEDIWALALAFAMGISGTEGKINPYDEIDDILAKEGTVAGEAAEEAAAIESSGEIGGTEGAGNTFKFSEMTPDEAMKIAQEYRTKAPIEIPESATMKPASKIGYEQISYNWRDANYKYEVRWHTRTPGAPENQGNTWVVERITPGSGGIPPKSEIWSGGQWISRFEWQEAIKAYQKGTATQRQLQILEQGHWKE